MESSSHFPLFSQNSLLASSPCGQHGLAAQPGRGTEVGRKVACRQGVPGEERGETGQPGAGGFSRPAVGILMAGFCLMRSFHKPALF